MDGMLHVTVWYSIEPWTGVTISVQKLSLNIHMYVCMVCEYFRYHKLKIIIQTYPLIDIYVLIAILPFSFFPKLPICTVQRAIFAGSIQPISSLQALTHPSTHRYQDYCAIQVQYREQVQHSFMPLHISLRVL